VKAAVQMSVQIELEEMKMKQWKRGNLSHLPHLRIILKKKMNLGQFLMR